MNSFMDELKQIDWVKNTLFLLAFLLLVTLFFVFFIKNSLVEFKQKNIEYRKSQFQYEQTKKILDDMGVQKKEFLNKNNKILSSFDEEYSDDKLLKFLGKFFIGVSIKEKSDINDTDYLHKSIRVEAVMESPNAFNLMLGEINGFGDILRVEFPIAFHVNDGKIKSEFTIKHFSIKKASKE